MKPKEIRPFQGKKDLKLVKEDGYVLYGTIDKVYEDSILFGTDQAQSLIRIEDIKTIVEKKR